MKAILADPAADLPRLLYADWLEENGDADRAEFIRLQIARAQYQADYQEFPHEARGQQLLHLHHRRWARLDELKSIEYGYRRGFVEWLLIRRINNWIDATRWQQYLPITWLRLLKVSRYANLFDATTPFSRITELSVSGTLSETQWQHLFLAVPSQNLQKLELHTSQDWSNMAQIIHSTNLTQLADEGTDQHTLFIEQQIVRGQKLALNRAVLEQSWQALQAELATRRQRVLTDVRQHFFEALAYQQIIVLSREFLQVAQKGQQIAQDRVEAGESSKVDVLQAQLQVNELELAIQQAEVYYQTVWQSLVAVVGKPIPKPNELHGELVTEAELEEWANRDWEQILDSRFVIGSAGPASPK